MTDNVGAMIDELLVVGSPGQSLRQAREQSNMSVREAAEKLHLLPNQVEYIEADDYQRFNGDIFCKGYLKSYGQLLGLDPAPLIAAYLQMRPEPDKQYKAAVKPAAPVQKPGKGHSIQYWCVAAFILVIGFLWFSFDSDNGPVTKPQMLDSPVVIDKQIESPQLELVTGIAIQDRFSVDAGGAENDTALVMLSAAAGASGETGEPDEQYRDEVAATPAPALLPGAANTDIVTASVSTGDSNTAVTVSREDTRSPGLAASQNDVLNFSFTKDCWVEVADGSDKRIFADLKRSGDTLELTGQPPFEVLLGYAPGVSLTYNGDPVDIEINRSNNRARFMIGGTAGE